MIRGARQLVTLRGRNVARRGADLSCLEIIEDGSVLIQDGRIVEVGPTRRVENLGSARKASAVDAAGRILIPAFVDCSTHLVSGEPDLAHAADEPNGRVSRRHAARKLLSSTARGLEYQAKRSVLGLARHGTMRTCSSTAGLGDLAGELKALKVLAELGPEPVVVESALQIGHAHDGAFDGRPADYLDWVCAELLPKVRQKKLTRMVRISAESSEWSASQVRHLLQTIRTLGFQIRVEAAVTNDWNPFDLAHEFQAVMVERLSYGSQHDVARLARSSTVALLLPLTHWHRRQFYPDARPWIDAGVAVALGSGFNPTASPSYSMPMAISLACNQMGLTPEEALTAATFNAAVAIGHGAESGSIEPGKRADLLLLEASDYREIPYYVGANLVAAAVKDGVLLRPEQIWSWPIA